MKTILLLMVLALPVMAQRKVWEVNLTNRQSTIYNVVTFVVDTQGNAVLLNNEYESTRNPLTPASTTLIVTDSRGRAVTHELPSTHEKWKVLSFRADSVLLQGSRKYTEEPIIYPSTTFLVKIRRGRATGNWLDYRVGPVTDFVYNETLLSGTDAAKSTYHGWMQFTRPAGFPEVTLGSGGGSYTYIFPIATKVALMKP
jgi:hypothetical protein